MAQARDIPVHLGAMPSRLQRCAPAIRKRATCFCSTIRRTAVHLPDLTLIEVVR